VYCSIALLTVLGSSRFLSAVFSTQFLKWTKSTPFPEPRAGYAAGALNGKLVVAGGTFWDGAKGNWISKRFTASTHAFDPSTQAWEKLPDAPISFGYGASAVAGAKLFLMGGYTGNAVNRKIFTLEYRQGRYAWSPFGEMPTDRVFAEGVGVGNFVYLLGGATRFEPTDKAGSCCTSKTATNSLMVLDTARTANGWRQLPPYPGARRWGFSAGTDGKAIWMFGGTFQANISDPVIRFNEVLRYQIAESKWEVLRPLPESAAGAPGAPLFLGDRVLLIGARKVWQLDLKTLEYSELSPLPEVAFVTTFVWLDNRIIGAGGENTIEGPRRRSEWTFIGRFVNP
jgi:N-acetylneuraminic acid mutarotase